jgi:hypothetical protein
VSTPLTISAPYHARHLYSEADVAHVLAGLSDQPFWPSQKIPVTSTAAHGHGGAARASSTFDGALGQAVRDCLIRPIALDSMGSRIAEHLDAKVSKVSNRFSCCIQGLTITGRAFLDPSSCCFVVRRSSRTRDPRSASSACTAGPFPWYASTECYSLRFAHVH